MAPWVWRVGGFGSATGHGGAEMTREGSLKQSWDDLHGWEPRADVP